MIPKIIHYCWFGGNPLPESAQMCIASWKKYCPNYEIKQWDENNFDCTCIPFVKEAYAAKKWAFVSDYARFRIIYTYGGIYLDTDVEIVKPFDPLLSLQGFAGFQDGNLVAPGLGFGAEKENPVVKALMETYHDRHFLRPDDSFDLTPIPKTTTETLTKRYGMVPDGTYQELDGITVFPVEYFCPKSFEDGVIRKTKNTYSIHHFDASWFSDETKQKLLESWAHKQKRLKKLKRRKVFGGFLRKLFGNARWERIKQKLQKGR